MCISINRLLLSIRYLEIFQSLRSSQNVAEVYAKLFTDHNTNHQLSKIRQLSTCAVPASWASHPQNMLWRVLYCGASRSYSPQSLALVHCSCHLQSQYYLDPGAGNVCLLIPWKPRKPSSPAPPSRPRGSPLVSPSFKVPVAGANRYLQMLFKAAHISLWKPPFCP